MANHDRDVVLIGAGIMSATLGALLRKLDPDLHVVVFERLDRAAAESSDAWNNAGTGHSGYCELNYTPRGPDGRVDCKKAQKIAAQFAQSLELWQALVAAGDLPDSPAFVQRVAHISFVTGDDVGFLRDRAGALRASPRFRDMEYTEERAVIAEWAPLLVDGRDPAERVAATRMRRGADVNFGLLTRELIDWLDRTPRTDVHLSTEVVDIARDGDRWLIGVRDLAKDLEYEVRARFVFIGAGGYSLDLLEATGIPEAKGYGAFPVSGQFMRCTNPAVIARHEAKVYGQAQVGAPPMSVPHLDTRFIDGERQLLFGPYAGITTKFLKTGSWTDLLGSIGIHNLGTMVGAGLANLDLTLYLAGQAMLSDAERMVHLRRFCPSGRDEDWEVQVAGLRVQILKSDGRGGGELRFGTEVVTSADGSVAALLGASPGASTAVAIMLELLERCFPERWASNAWHARLAALVPSVHAR
ncbi:MAG: malate dehydrogenase (quinone) [Polyangiales bacterium]